MAVNGILRVDLWDDCVQAECSSTEGEMTTSQQITVRMRRKIEIMRMDTKAKNDPIYHDMNELLSLLDMLERNQNGGQADGAA
jgi:hypothetical protein